MAWPRSLQGRLLLTVLGLVAGVWVAAVALTGLDARHELDELLDGHLAQAAALLVARQAGEMEGEEHEIDAPSLHRYAPRVAFQVFHEGRLVLRSANAPSGPMIALDGQASSGLHTVRIGTTTWRVFSARGAEQDVQVLVGEQLNSRRAILGAVLRGMLWPLLVALPVLALAAWWAVRQGVAPMRRLGAVLKARTPQALQPVQVADAPSEMAPMLDALNGLFERIKALMVAERRFTADAAHELRTPIAAIRAQAQAAMGEQDEPSRQHALRATLQGCDRASHLVAQLLTLSRLESDVQPGWPPVELAPLVRHVAAELAAQSLARQQILELQADGPCRITGDATLLAVLVRNLVDNAIRYSPPGAAIRLALAGAAGRVTLCVEDSGPGMGQEHMDRLGERFFRVLGSGQDGSGLGWSIVRRVAACHRGQVQVDRSATLGGLRVQVTWPAAGE
ncbi:MAG TPA: ATP-binding protein [Burkholderiaceae bacterium]|nr:ATP-binding protein [Burkholderiaceae bacterium]